MKASPYILKVALVTCIGIWTRVGVCDPTCLALAEQARLACTTTDTVAGMGANAGTIANLISQVKQGNSQVGTTGATQASQCSNQSDISSKMAAISALKAQACSTALGSCQTTCGYSAQMMSGFANAYSTGGESGPAQSASSLASTFSSNNNTCGGYQSNVAQASQQASQMLANAGVNQSCLAATQQTGADTMGVADAGAEHAAGVGAVKLGNGAPMPIGSVTLGSADDGGSGGGSGRSSAGGSPNGIGAVQLGDGGASGGSDGSGVAPPGSGAEAYYRGVASTGSGGGPNGAGAAGAGQGAVGANGNGTNRVGGNKMIIVGQRGGMPITGVSAEANRGNMNGVSNVGVADGVTSASGPSLFEKVTRQYRRQKDFIVEDGPKTQTNISSNDQIE